MEIADLGVWVFTVAVFAQVFLFAYLALWHWPEKTRLQRERVLHQLGPLEGDVCRVEITRSHDKDPVKLRIVTGSGTGPGVIVAVDVGATDKINRLTRKQLGYWAW